MNKVFNIIVTIILLSIILIIYLNIDRISGFFSMFFEEEKEVLVKEKNKYARSYDYERFEVSEDYYPYNVDDIANIFFNVLNSGYEDFTFYCPSEYEDCMKDVKAVANDKVFLSKINNYISPYNSFYKFNTSIARDGTISIEVIKNYSETQINELEKRVNDIIYELNIDSKKSEVEKIKAIHNYIIKNVMYDDAMAKDGKSSYLSNSAYGALVQGYAICTGYSDAMALFLDKLGIPNLKVSSDEHVWNLVYIDGEWLHLDLTWNDTENVNFQDLYFLINNEELKNYDAEKHNYDTSFYIEAK